MKENIYPIGFWNKEELIDIIKSNLPEDICVKTIDSKSFQEFLILSDDHGKIILNYDKSGHFILNLTQCKEPEKIQQSLEKALNLDYTLPGKYRTKTWKLTSPNLSRELLEILIDNFPNQVKKIKHTPDMYFQCKLIGKNTLTHMKNGDLHLRVEHRNKAIDEIYEIIESFLKDKISQNMRKLKEIDVGKESYEDFIKNHISIDIVQYIDKDVYNYLSGRDVWEISDGLRIFHMIKIGNIPLKNYKCLVRNFSIAFEGFLIKYFLEIGFIDKEEYEQDPTTARIFSCINRLRKEYGEIINRREKGLTGTLSGLWVECRNNYLHSDMYSFSHLYTIKEAESKIIEILLTMKRLLNVLPLIRNNNTNGDES